jgi:hypothetical protein
MQSTKSQTHNKPNTKTNANPLEAFRDLGRGLQNSTVDGVKGIGGGVMDAFFGAQDDIDMWEDELNTPKKAPEKVQEAPKPKKKEHKSVFKYAEHHEKVDVQNEIKQLLQVIREEIKVLERQNSALLADVQDIQNAAINELPEDPGVYHVRFFEILLSVIRSLREKVGESSTWLEAMMSKKKKRGSLFAARSKAQGTQYSLSQEHQVSRSVQ